eukprot:604046-Pyramimonas_sp.AAC.1
MSDISEDPALTSEGDASDVDCPDEHLAVHDEASMSSIAMTSDSSSDASDTALTSEGDDEFDSACTNHVDIDPIPRYLDGTVPDDFVEIFSPPRLVPE